MTCQCLALFLAFFREGASSERRVQLRDQVPCCYYMEKLFGILLWFGEKGLSVLGKCLSGSVWVWLCQRRLVEEQ